MFRFVALVGLAACQPAVAGMPWLHGLDDAVVSTGSSRATGELADDCGIGAAQPIELVADVAPTAGRETIVASYRGGIAVFDREDHLVAEAPGYPCAGSADELEVVAAGTASGQPMLAIAASTGGHNETATWVGLFHTGRTLEPVFTGVVETRVGDEVERGAILLFPGGLFYRRPGGPVAVWRLDPGARIYVPVQPDVPHAEPPIVSLR